MTRLILTFDDSAAGSLKEAKLADCVIPFGLCFVGGRLPPESELAVLFSSRAGQSRHWLDNLRGTDPEAGKLGLGLIEFCERFDTVELWVDPEPNAQLQLVWLLDYFRSHPRVTPKLALVQSDVRIGEHLPSYWTEHRPPAVPIGDSHLQAAHAAWSAWRAPTPQSLFDLLSRDLNALPRLRDIVVALLEELPGRATGLGATEMRMLQLVAEGHVHPFGLFPGDQLPNERRTFGYWEVGELLDGLAHCPAPAIMGLDEGPFTLEMHNDYIRHERYKQSELILTHLGKAILVQTEDFSRHNPVHRWWGAPN